MNPIHKKPWCIWFSFLGFAFLWCDTGRRIKFHKADFDEKFILWGRACGDFFKITILTLGIIGLFVWIFDVFFPIPELAERTLVHELAAMIQLLVAYFFGVYATYKHHIWRQENISHLLTTSSPSKESAKENSPDKSNFSAKE